MGYLLQFEQPRLCHVRPSETARASAFQPPLPSEGVPSRFRVPTHCILDLSCNFLYFRSGCNPTFSTWPVKLKKSRITLLDSCSQAGLEQEEWKYLSQCLIELSDFVQKPFRRAWPSKPSCSIGLDFLEYFSKLKT